jgi:hypothetical protein
LRAFSTRSKAVSRRHRVARALRGTWGEKHKWESLPPRRQQAWLELADSALKAMDEPMEKPKRLIDNWRSWHRFWSVRLNALGIAILTWVQFDPVGVLYVWSLLPEDVRMILPPRFLMFVGLGLFALSMLARVVKQKRD